MIDIIDRIDELVDEQLALGESQSDYLNDDPDYPRCPHCNRHWHGLRITQRITNMYSYGSYDEGYSAAEDDSAILCEGSEFIGPQRPSPGQNWTVTIGQDSSWSFLGFIDESTVELHHPDDIRWSITVTPNAAVNRLQFNLYEYAWGQIRDTIFPRWTLYDGGWYPLWTSGPDPEPCTVEVVVEFGPQNWIHELTAPQMQYPRDYRTPLYHAVCGRWDQLTAPDYPLPVSPGIDCAALEATIIKPQGTGPELPPLRKRSPR